TNGTNGSAALTIANLVRGGTGAVVNFVGNNALGQTGLNTTQILLGSLNSAAPTLTNSILGGWAIANSADFATWNAAQGVGALGSGTFAAYDVLASTGTFTSSGTQNVKLLAAGTLSAGGQTMNSLNIAGAFGLTFSAGTDTLTLTSGGLLKTGNAASIGTAGTAGVVTSGTSELFVTNATSGQTLTVFSKITGGTVVLSGPGSFLLSPQASNTYTGATYLNGGPVTTGSLALTVVPGDLVINNTTLTMGTVAGQIASASNVTLNGGASLTLYGNNTLNSVRFNNTGAQATPTLNSGAQSQTPTTVTNGSLVIVMAGSYNLTIGQLVSGTGVIPGTRITAV
ncbi:MAG: hypothetical protein EBR81_18000, partial [Proteobacteria bacterium]|nr:hypothetical protein [Pseudomonadota bacterium]